MDDVAALAQLLAEVGAAHHEAFAATDGFDPEWPAWYAEHLEPRLRDRIDYRGSRAELAAWLVEADRRHRAEAPTRPWPSFFALLLDDGD
ncbi:MAG TPA: hypothetical protein VGC11_03175 [Acidimicrobiia bacterium]